MSKKSKSKNKNLRQGSREHSMRFEIFEEPELIFGNEQKDIDQKRGITDFGPYTVHIPAMHRSSIKIGIIGSIETIESTKAWLERCSEPIEGVEDKLRQFPNFPGFNYSNGSPFKAEFLVDKSYEQILTQREIESVVRIQNRRESFQRAIDLVSSSIQLLSEDHSPDVIILSIPQKMYDVCRAIGGPKDISCAPKLTPTEKAILRLAKRDRKQGQGLLFSDLYKIDAEDQLVYRSFRRAIKARVMKWRCPIQIMKPSTLYDERHILDVKKRRETLRKLGVEDPATRAWNFCVGVYYKAGGTPWKLANVDPGTCFVGVSFYRHHTLANPHMHSCLAQLFTDYGDAVVIRGERVEWDTEKGGKTPHLSAEQASRLMERVIETYRSHAQTNPRKIVLHKSSRFMDEEREGFESALECVNQYDLVHISSQRNIRCFREGEYPPIRGTYCFIPGGGHLVYTSGYIPSLDTYPSPHVPMPLEIVEHIGDSDIRTLCQDILRLTKMNWNSAEHSGVPPITLRFARLVGEIMSELPEEEEAHPSYRFYI